MEFTPVFWLAAITMPAWFGHIRYWTPLLHRDDHGNLARQAVRFVIGKAKAEAPLCDLTRYSETLEKSCGLLDMVDLEREGGLCGELRWGYSHFYDPVAGRGFDDGNFVNALQEFVDYWKRALFDERRGNPGEAFRSLGYCCHLLQDMAVPAHTYCVVHGLKNRTSDNLELVASSRRIHLDKSESSLPTDVEDLHIKLFMEMGMESRGRRTLDSGKDNEVADILKRYYAPPRQTGEGWEGAYIGECYYPYHRLVPSSPKIKRADLIRLRDFLMARAVGKTARLIEHFVGLVET